MERGGGYPCPCSVSTFCGCGICGLCIRVQVIPYLQYRPPLFSSPNSISSRCLSFSPSLRLSRFLAHSHAFSLSLTLFIPLYICLSLSLSIPLCPSLSLSVSPWPSLFYSTLCLLFRPLVSSLIQHADEIGQHYDPSTQGVMSLLLEEFSSVSKLVQKQLDLADTYVE